jgi:bacterioferritin
MEQKFVAGGPGPFPKGKILGKNPYYARLLMDDYAGDRSELTACTQYMYQSSILEEAGIRHHQVLQSIGIREMLHLRHLARAIRQLGGDPIYAGGRSTRGRFWNSGYVNYAKEPYWMVEDDARGEREAIAQYREHMRLIDDPAVRALLARIIEDEEVHVRLLEDLLREMEKPGCAAK